VGSTEADSPPPFTGTSSALTGITGVSRRGLLVGGATVKLVVRSAPVDSEMPPTTTAERGGTRGPSDAARVGLPITPRVLVALGGATAGPPPPRPAGLTRGWAGSPTALPPCADGWLTPPPRVVASISFFCPSLGGSLRPARFAGDDIRAVAHARPPPGSELVFAVDIPPVLPAATFLCSRVKATPPPPARRVPTRSRRRKCHRWNQITF
jgi:hypothetical protein